jgi:hypothetical protein
LNKLTIFGIIFLILLVPNVLSATYSHGFNFTTSTNDTGTYGAMINLSSPKEIISITKHSLSTATKCQIWSVAGTSIKINGTLLSNGSFVGNNCTFINSQVINANTPFMITTNSNGSNRVMYYNNTPQMNNGTFNGVQWYFRVASFGSLWNDTITLSPQGAIEIVSFTTSEANFFFYPPTPSNGSLFQNNSQNNIAGNVTGAGLNNISVYLSRSGTLINSTFAIGNSTTFNYTNLANGIYTLNATAFNSTSQLWTDNRIITIYNALLTINTIPSTSFSVNVGTDNYNSTSNQVQALVINGTTYNVFVDAPNYAYASQNVTIVQTLQSVTLNLNAINSIYFSIFNAANGNRVFSPTTSVSMVNSNNASFSGVSNASGVISLFNVTPGSYIATFTNLNFSISQLSVSVSNRSSQDISVFLTNGTAVLLNTKISGGGVLPGVSIVVRSYVNGSLVPIQSGISDVTGKFQFVGASNQYYDFNCSISGYQSYFFSLNPILFSSYDVPFSVLVSGSIQPTAYVSWTPSSFVNNRNSVFYSTFVSPYGSFVNYSVRVTAPGVLNVSRGTNSFGSVLNLNFTPLGSNQDSITLFYEWYLSNGVYQNFTYSYPLITVLSNRTLTSTNPSNFGLLLGDRVLLVTIIALIFGGVMWLAGGLIGGIVGTGFIFLLFLNNNFFSISESNIFVGSLVILVLLFIFRGRQ